MFRLCAALATGALMLAGCGGGGSSTSDSSSSAAKAPPSPSAPATQGTAGSGGAQTASAEGKQIFTQDCGGCHKLKDAGTSGTVGPDLDTLKPDKATAKQQVINGGGPMPAFKDKLTPKQIDDVATYVSSVAGQS